MTAHDLREILKNIKKLKSQKIRLEATADKKSGKEADETILKIGKLKREIKRLERLYDKEVNRLSKEVLQENCLYLHYAKGYSWNKISMQIGGNNTGDGIRMKCERYEW